MRKNKLTNITIIFISIVIFLYTSSLQAEDPPQAKDNPYIVGQGDVLRITVWKEPELTRDVIVEPDGNITVPLIGQVMAKGKTIPQIQLAISILMAEYIPSAKVSVLPVKIDSYIYVVGKVKNPALYLTRHTVNVLQAITMAGGHAPFASIDTIYIIRKIDGKNIKIPVKYKEILEGKKLDQNIDLLLGDVVVVPLIDYKIYVVGKVKNPGVYETAANVTVLQAISMAGGHTPFASIDTIYIIRKVNGKDIKIPVNYEKILEGKKLDQNIDLLPDDVVVVP